MGVYPLLAMIGRNWGKSSLCLSIYDHKPCMKVNKPWVIISMVYTIDKGHGSYTTRAPHTLFKNWQSITEGWILGPFSFSCVVSNSTYDEPLVFPNVYSRRSGNEEHQAQVPV